MLNSMPLAPQHILIGKCRGLIVGRGVKGRIQTHMAYVTLQRKFFPYELDVTKSAHPLKD
jgi:hypothetical protein